MAEFTYLDIKKARKESGLAQWEAAQAAGVSESTYKKWEAGDPSAKPGPDDIDALEAAFKAPGMWHAWMCSNCDSYRKRYRNLDVHDYFSSVVAVRHEIEDVLRLQDAAERDAISGNIDDPVLRKSYLKELDEAASRIALTKIIIQSRQP